MTKTDRVLLGPRASRPQWARSAKNPKQSAPSALCGRDARGPSEGVAAFLPNERV